MQKKKNETLEHTLKPNYIQTMAAFNKAVAFSNLLIFSIPSSMIISTEQLNMYLVFYMLIDLNWRSQASGEGISGKKKKVRKNFWSEKQLQKNDSLGSADKNDLTYFEACLLLAHHS